MHTKETISFDWFFWFQWIMVTTMGWILGTVMIPPVDLAISGVAIGVLQWVILQPRMGQGRQWLLASAVGWTAGWVLTLAAIPTDFGLLAGIVLGVTVGTSQWLVLRHKVHWAGWWILVSTLAWAAGMGLLPGFLMSGVTAGAISGLAMELLLRTPKPATSDNGDL
jgi:hypothetical protein